MAVACLKPGSVVANRALECAASARVEVLRFQFDDLSRLGQLSPYREYKGCVTGRCLMKTPQSPQDTLRGYRHARCDNWFRLRGIIDGRLLCRLRPYGHLC